MICLRCQEEEVQKGTTSVTLELGAMWMTVERVPAEICSHCGEEYLDEKTSHALEELAQRAATSGRFSNVRDYFAA